MRRLLALLVLVTSCGFGKTTEADISGSYALQTVNGQPLPYQTSASNVVFSLQSGVLLLGPGGAFSLQKQGTQKIGTAAPSSFTETITGTWSATGNSVTMRSTNPPTLIAATYWRGLGYTDGGVTYSYRR